MKPLLLLTLGLLTTAQSFALRPDMTLCGVSSTSHRTYIDSLSSRSLDSGIIDEPKLIQQENRSAGLIRYAAPLAPVIYGMMSLNNRGMVVRLDHQINHEMMEGKTHFSSPIEDKLQYAPLVAVYTLNALGVQGRHNLIDRTGIYLMAHSCMSIAVGAGKSHLLKERPTGALRSFPSGHTATAFTAAEFMHQEYKDTSPWLGYAGYSAAAATGILRMEHNKHWFSDVVAGAGVGILSTKLSYVVYPWMKDKLFHDKTHFIVVPSFSDRTCGLTFDATF